MAQISKVHYRPIEAAIRWSGLVRHEGFILGTLKAKRIPEHDDFPRWPSLRLNAERIDDAIAHGELPCELNGAAVQDPGAIDDAQLTIRHVDLKTWMARFYPEHKPSFLFGRLERCLQSGITMDSVHALLVEREGLRLQVANIGKELQAVRSRNGELLKRCAADQPAAADSAMSVRSEMTYSHIIGGLLTLLLGRAPSGQPYSSFRTQDAIISALLAHHGQRLGISQRTLAAKFAAARRALDQ